jgi:hypothetical protein
MGYEKPVIDSEGAAPNAAELERAQRAGPPSYQPEKPQILVNTFGSHAPAAAVAGVGARDLAEIEQATSAVRTQRVGKYDHQT